MADISDVLNVITAQCTALVYPNGTSQPSVADVTVRVYPGWPASSSLDQDLQLGNVNVSIFPSGPEKNTTRYQTKPHVMSIAQATLTLTAEGSSVTVGGAMPTPFKTHNMAVLIASKAFIYPVQASDTLTSIATALATLIAATYPGTTSAGPVITVVGAPIETVRVGTTGVTATEWERQIQRVQITIWAPDPTSRNLVSATVKAGLSQIAFLTMPDGFGARVRANGGTLSDLLEKAKVYRRDLFYDVEYATTVEETSATVVTVRTDFQTMEGGEIRTIDS